jgi:cytochrome c553
LLVLFAGLSCCSGYRSCQAPPLQLQALPLRLSQTGLLHDRLLQDESLQDALNSPGQAPGGAIRAYAPAFALWSDGASKRRWVSLPEGARIDTSNPDDWSFPVGTRFWKEFSLAGRRIETRLLTKVGPGGDDWAGAAYVWDADQRDATLTPEGVEDADGQGYEVPSATACRGCHGGRQSHVLGFSALQLAQPGLPLTLDHLASEGRLTRVPRRAPVSAGSLITGSDLERSALGYLHANCAHCHNQQRPEREDGARCYDPQRSIDFSLPSSLTNPAGAPAITTTVPRFVTPGEPDASRLIALVSRRGFLLHMPPLGSHRVDADGVRLLRAWIEGMGAPR